jgi:small subunit ribosomal protein S25e
MGSVKKKSLAAMEKNQQGGAQSQGGQDSQTPQKKAKEGKPMTTAKRNDVLLPRSSDQDLLKSLVGLKAITIYGASRSLGVNASVAKVVISNLESKGLVKRVGGFSGHYVWSAAAS